MQNLIIEQNALVTNQQLKDVDVTQLTIPEQTDWLTKTSQVIQSWENVLDASIMYQAQLLYNVYENWDNIAKEVTANWGYDFYEWAKKCTKRRAKEQAKSTIANKISVYSDWVENIEKIGPPPTVFLEKKDNNGEVIIDNNGEVIYDEVEFDPMVIDYGKLLVARGRAKKGDMSERAWEILVDPQATVQDLKNEFMGDLDKKEDLEDQLYIYYNEGVLLSCSSKGAVPTLQVIEENSHEPLFNEGLQFLAKTLKLDIPQSIKTNGNDGYPVAYINGEDNLVIKGKHNNVGIYTNRDDILTIYNACQELLTCKEFS